MSALPVEGRFAIRGPSPGNPVVAAWTDGHLPLDLKHVWQKDLRADIRSRVRQLSPATGQLLHTIFFGPKPSQSDIENLLLYNIGSLRPADVNGVRFEHGESIPPAPDAADYMYSYRYSPAPLSGSFADWRRGRMLASFDWIDVGASLGKGPAPIWFALAHRGVHVTGPPREPDTPFALTIHIRPPDDTRRAWGGFVKQLFDGVIASLQAHTDVTVLPEVAARLATAVPSERKAIEQLLTTRHQAVLGPAHQLVSLRGPGVQWNPSNHWCRAGELLPVEPVDTRWAIKGEAFELAR